MDNLSGLACELKLLIADQLVTARDKAAIAASCQELHSAVNPHLYRFHVRSQGGVAVLWAAQNGRLGTLRLLQAQGADLDMTHKQAPELDHNGETNVRRIACLPCPDMTANSLRPRSTILASSRAKERRSPYFTANRRIVSYTPLHLAARGGHEAVVTFLLDNGADIDGPARLLCQCNASNEGFSHLQAPPPIPHWSPLHTAICHGQEGVARLLVRRNASLTISRNGEPLAPFTTGGCYSRSMSFSNFPTALYFAVQRGMRAVVDELAERTDFDVNERDGAGCTALYHAVDLACQGVEAAATTNSLVPLLISLGADLDLRDSYSRDPLTRALMLGHFRVARGMLAALSVAQAAQVDPARRRLRYCCMPQDFFVAAHPSAALGSEQWEQDRVACIRLLARLEDVNTPYPAYDVRPQWAFAQGSTPLHVACLFQAGTLVLTTLLSLGADPNLADVDGYTPLWRVVSSSNGPELVGLDQIRLLLAHGARLDLPLWSVPAHFAVLQRALETPCAGDAGRKSTEEILNLLVQHTHPAKFDNPVRSFP